MPNAQSGVAEYGYQLLRELAALLHTTVVVPDTNELTAILPNGVRKVSPDTVTQGLKDPFRVQLYHMGNHNLFHSWMLSPMDTNPGITVLHDLSLFDLFRGLYDGSPELWHRELIFNGYDLELAHSISADGRDVPDRLHYNFLQSAIRNSKLTVCHSRFGCDFVSNQFPHLRTQYIPLAAKVQHDTEDLAAAVWDENLAPPSLAVIGGISKPKRPHVVIKAFANVLHRAPNAKLVIAGRCDDIAYFHELEDLVANEQLSKSVSFRLDVTSEELQQIISSSRMIITLRWPTAGETSAVVMQALGSGRVVVTSDVPQFREFDESYVKLVTIDDTMELRQITNELEWALLRPFEVKNAGNLARSWVASNATFAKIAEKYAEVITTVAAGTARKAGKLDSKLGVNAFGDWEATTGLAHAARRLVTALIDQGVRVSPNYVDSFSPHDKSLVPSAFTELPESNTYPVELHTLNINEFHLTKPRTEEMKAITPYRIATWAWEFPFIPESLQKQIQYVDEIWVISTFIQRAFRRYTDKPITVVPCIVPQYKRPPISTAEMRRNIGLPMDKTLFLFSFDYNSTVDRKNPMAVIEAYAAAAADEEFRESNCLVIKSVHARDPFKTELELALKQVGGIHINWHLSEGQMAMLFHSIDVYVSLHRAEGFGLGMAECMAIGKPVIATSYSGNLDFMNTSNSCLVGYRLRSLSSNDFAGNEVAQELFQVGNLWAEPDIKQATQYIRLLADSITLRHSIGIQAQKTISADFSISAVGGVATTRLREIYQENRLFAPWISEQQMTSRTSLFDSLRV